MNKTLECSICLEPLTEAVSLANCNHKLNLECAKKIFGEMKNGCCQTPNPCPICKTRVTAYSVDHTFRSLVNEFLQRLPSGPTQAPLTGQKNESFQNVVIESYFIGNPERIERREVTRIHELLIRPFAGLETIKAYIDRAPDLTTKNDKEETPLHLAVKLVATDIGCRSDYLSHGTDPQFIAYQISEEILDYMLQKNPDVNVSDDKGKTPLHYAAAYNHLENVKKLIEHGANINGFDKRGCPPLYYINSTYFLFYPDKVRTYLLENGARPNFLNKEDLKSIVLKSGETHSYLDESKFSTVKDLLEKGFNPNLPDNEGNTLLHYVGPLTNLDQIRFLINKGANTRLQNHKGQTPAEKYKANYVTFIALRAIDRERLALLR